jgi:putative tryptophan/tyrosine transport system substrate-binding protein
MMRPVTRRLCIVLVGVTALPINVGAQQPSGPTIGILDSAPATPARLTAFYEGLKIEGFVRNQNIAVEYSSAQGDYAQLPALAADLVNRRVSFIAALGAPAALAAKAATTTIPIVFAIEPNPVTMGLVSGLNHPGANLAGAASMAVGRERKRLELLHESIPAATACALLVNPNNSNADAQIKDVLAAAQDRGLQVKVVRAGASRDLGNAFAELVQARVSSMIIADDDLFLSASAALGSLAARHGLAAIFEGPDFVTAGGLMSYGSRLMELYHQGGVYSGLVLRGAAPAELPIYQSTGTDMIVNLRRARSLGVALPQTIIERANTVIK